MQFLYVRDNPLIGFAICFHWICKLFFQPIRSYTFWPTLTLFGQILQRFPRTCTLRLHTLIFHQMHNVWSKESCDWRSLSCHLWLLGALYAVPMRSVYVPIRSESVIQFLEFWALYLKTASSSKWCWFLSYTFCAHPPMLRKQACKNTCSSYTFLYVPSGISLKVAFAHTFWLRSFTFWTTLSAFGVFHNTFDHRRERWHGRVYFPYPYI